MNNHGRASNLEILVLVSLVTILLLWAWLCPNAHAQSAEINMDVIAQIESSCNPNAVSFLGAKYGRGMYQVSEICLQEFNNYNDCDYKPESLFDEDTCYMIASWYYSVRIPQMLNHYGIQDTIKNRIFAYSAGIGNVIKNRMPKETKDYINKYNERTRHDGK